MKWVLRNCDTWQGLVPARPPGCSPPRGRAGVGQQPRPQRGQPRAGARNKRSQQGGARGWREGAVHAIGGVCHIRGKGPDKRVAAGVPCKENTADNHTKVPAATTRRYDINMSCENQEEFGLFMDGGIVPRGLFARNGPPHSRFSPPGRVGGIPWLVPRRSTTLRGEDRGRSHPRFF